MPLDDRWTVNAMRARSHKRCLFEARMRQHHAIILSLRHRRDDSPLVVRRIFRIFYTYVTNNSKQRRTNKPHCTHATSTPEVVCDVWSRQRIAVSLQTSHARIALVGLSAEVTALHMFNYHTCRRRTLVSALPSLTQQLQVGQL